MKNTKTIKVSRETMKAEKWTRQQKLDYYCNLNDIVTIATNNGKLGSQICGISLPPIMTCRQDAPCKKFCYACKGHQQFSSVLGTYMKNFRLFQENPNKFFLQIKSYLEFSGYRYCRFFDAGDIPNKDFLLGMVQLCKDCPNIKFMGFTKQYELVNDYISSGYSIPENLTIIFSTWDKNWKVPNPHNLPMSFVDFKDSSLNTNIPNDAFECTNHCSTCFKCWHLKKKESVVFHQH
jgi:hypothetical protein